MKPLADALLRGERSALAKTISLVESRARRHRSDKDALLSAALPQRAASAMQTLRIGISGPPGAGKSTLIEALGGELLSRGHRLAVLAVDPSSARSGGSVLGDKTRMPTLASDRRAFIRPSPSRGELGGVARRTGDVMLLCECAGYDRVFIETVGVGQSEITVASMVDMFVLLVPPGAGDELQGIKRGIMELADVVVVTKADGELRRPAHMAATQLRSALKVLQPRSPHWTPRVLEVSAQSHKLEDGGEGREESDEAGGDGLSRAAGAHAEGRSPRRRARQSLLPADTIGAVADCFEEFQATMVGAGALVRRREAQAAHAVREHALASLLERLGEEGEVEELVESLAVEAAEGRLAPSQAGSMIAQKVLGDIGRPP